MIIDPDRAPAALAMTVFTVLVNRAVAWPASDA